MTSTPASTRPLARVVASDPPPTAAATRRRPCWSLLALGCSRRLKISLTVISPFRIPRASTTGSFSMRCWARIRSASSRLVPDGRGDQLVLGHRLADRLVEVPLELQVAVGDDADQPPLAIHDRHARDLEPPHQGVRLPERAIGTERDGIEDHPALAPLDLVDFGGLPLDRHVLVQHADAAGAGHRDGHLGLGDGVHGGGDERDVEGDGAGEATDGRDFARVHRRVSRHEEHVVEREARLGADDGHGRLGGVGRGVRPRCTTACLSP